MTSTSTPIDWRARAKALQFRNQAFINGRYVNAVSGESFACVSPIDGQTLTHVAACDAADIDLAVSAARQAFENGTWRTAAPVERKRVLLKFADLIEANKDELALLETLDMGKPITDMVTAMRSGERSVSSALSPSSFPTIG